MAAADVQPSNIAGTWYPGSRDRLRAAVDEFLEAAAPAKDETLSGAVVPHAGYRYSGRAAGAAYARIPAGRWGRAVILAPSHYHAFEGGAVHPGSGFETPLGIAEIDQGGVAELVGHGGFFLDRDPYFREHALEIQLPFLQVLDPALCVVPVLVAGRSLSSLAPGLRALDDGRTLFLVSSDFTHYGASFDYLPFPPSGAEEVSRRLRVLDFGAIDAVCAGDAALFESYVSDTGITVCGRAPLASFLHARGGTLRGEVVSYYTSLDVTGDYQHSVSYAAIVFRNAS